MFGDRPWGMPRRGGLALASDYPSIGSVSGASLLRMGRISYPQDSRIDACLIVSSALSILSVAAVAWMYYKCVPPARIRVANHTAAAPCPRFIFS